MISTLPRLIFIADRFTDSQWYERCISAAEAGVPWIQLRDHEAAPDVFLEKAEALIERIGSTSPGTMISVNANLEVAAAFDTGFHTGLRGPEIEEARVRLGPGGVIGFSAHSQGAGEAAKRVGADYLFYSPIYETSSKLGKPGVGIPALDLFCRHFGESMPVFAVGGMTPERVPECRSAGAYGVAVVSGIAEASDMESAVEQYLAGIEVG